MGLWCGFMEMRPHQQGRAALSKCDGTASYNAERAATWKRSPQVKHLLRHSQPVLVGGVLSKSWLFWLGTELSRLELGWQGGAP